MSVSNPKADISIIPAYQRVRNQAQRVLFIGQKTAAGSATQHQAYYDIGNGGEEDGLFGKNSMLAIMLRAAKKINKQTRFDAISVDDNGTGVAATATITFSGGAATSAGTIKIAIASKINHTYSLDVTTGQTDTAIAAAFDALIDADDEVPVTSVDAGTVITLTAINKGTVMNKTNIEVISNTVGGIGIALTAFVGGANDPTLTNIFVNVQNLRYQTIVWPYSSSAEITILLNFLDPRFNLQYKVMDGIAITAVVDTLANLKTYGNTYNSQSLMVIGDQIMDNPKHRGSAIPELTFDIISQIAAIRSLRLTEGANLTKYVIANVESLDNAGGMSLASLPYFNTPFINLALISEPWKKWSQTEIDELEEAGISILGNNVADTLIISGPFVTTYKKDLAGDDDISFKFVNYVDTLSNIREYIYNNLKADFAQSRLTEGNLIPGRNMANKEVIQAAILGYYRDLANLGLTQAEENARKYFIRNLFITLDLALGKAIIKMRVPIITQLREIEITLQVSFSTTT